MRSSGFLDLKSLMALSQTCKAHALDELSLIIFIENEMTRNHGVQTMEEAIAFWRKVRQRDEFECLGRLHCILPPSPVTSSP